MFKTKIFIPALSLAALAACDTGVIEDEKGKPNILIIYADDLGLGDVSTYGAEHIQTPNIDSLAENGAKFTNAYATSAMCTPSRYSLLTGKYPFRNEDAVILSAEDPLCIDTQTTTLPDILGNYGYCTGIVGKWHLGLGGTEGGVNWNEAIKPGPLEVGFDRSFILPVTNDRVPTVFVDGHYVYNLSSEDDSLKVRYPDESHHEYIEQQAGREGDVTFKPLIGDLPTGLTHPKILRYGADVQHSGTIVNSISRIGHMAGGQSAWWDDEQMTRVFADKAKVFIDQVRNQPFFLYLSMHQPHVPRLPNPEFVGSSDVGLRGDVVVEFDWIVGEMMRYLRKKGELDNTLIIVTSDNGPVLFDGYHDSALEEVGDHKPNDGFRGGKYIAYEAGTRVPTIAHWPCRIEPGTVSDALISQVDFLTSLVSLAGGKVPDDENYDSENILPALLGESQEGKEYIVQHSSDGLGLRKGKWKYIESATRSDFAYIRHNRGDENSMHIKKPDTIQYLFDLEKDCKETNNLAAGFPEKLNELKKLLTEIKDEL
jgi:arylsulfatase A-like enzyme